MESVSEIKLKQEVIDSIQERIDKECYFVGEEWVISSDEALEIVTDVIQKTMERIIERLEGKVKYYSTLGDESDFPSSLVQYEKARHYKNSLKIVKEVGRIE